MHSLYLIAEIGHLHLRHRKISTKKSHNRPDVGPFPTIGLYVFPRTVRVGSGEWGWDTGRCRESLLRKLIYCRLCVTDFSTNYNLLVQLPTSARSNPDIGPTFVLGPFVLNRREPMRIRVRRIGTDYGTFSGSQSYEKVRSTSGKSIYP